jgi:hypothetical protein
LRGISIPLALCVYDDETLTPHEITVEGEEVLSHCQTKISIMRPCPKVSEVKAGKSSTASKGRWGPNITV